MHWFNAGEAGAKRANADRSGVPAPQLYRKVDTRMGKGLFGRLENELAARDKAAGLTMADLLGLPAPQRRLVQWLMRDGEAGWPDVIAHVGQDERAAQTLIDALVERGFVRATTVGGVQRYAARIGTRRKRDLPLNIWTALTNKINGAEGEQS